VSHRKVREWTLHEELGRGGMGVVVRATHSYLSGDHAIKLIRPELLSDEEVHARFVREAWVLARLIHPGIVRVFPPFKENGQLHIPMEHLRGRTLAGALDAAGAEARPFPIARAVAIVGAAAEAVGFAHAQEPSVLHRDLKPGNVFVQEDGAVKVLDFGLARTLGDQSVTGSGFAVGTPAYLAPEVLEGRRASPASDVYALGLVLYRLLAGRLPFDLPEADSPVWSVLTAIIRGYQRGMPAVKAFNAEVGDGLSSLLARVLDRDPGVRPMDGRALAARLREVAVERGARPEVERRGGGDKGADATRMGIELGGRRGARASVSSAPGDEGRVHEDGTYMGIRIGRRRAEEVGTDAATPIDAERAKALPVEPVDIVTVAAAERGAAKDETKSREKPR
jgi:serine/threonine protein kinase